jgi:hypothetical protein
MLKANVPKLDPREEHFWVAGPRPGMQLFLRRLSPAQPAPKDRIALYVHGGTFPSALSIAHRFDGSRGAMCCVLQASMSGHSTATASARPTAIPR